MSIAPCQVCGGTGFIDAPAPIDQRREDADDSRTEEVTRAPGQPEKIPCPVCSASGSNTGL